ncbi:L-arabinose transport system permease protein AraQ [Cellulomonas hominis]|uniref:Arabinosaccharide transport system permease protein n=1 Tax=Cellulomonas hominis TaxID=156981 RepID=A0A511FE17_9CELL|nr:carbohydrate ABC transporter permease [Cellulomonas hominis]MBB5472795.1 arabinosaccharide transport system permease protein [Cellulomonas hominis]GEL46567.1 L-arabinose transport system permease protein AraQ [Cellulomonas hominis]
MTALTGRRRTGTPPSSRSDGQEPGTRRVLSVGQSVVLVAIALTALVPLAAIFIATFQDGADVMRGGVSLGVDTSTLSLDNWTMLFTDSGPYFRWFANSLVLTTVQVAGTLLVSSFVAYGFAMYEFRGRTPLFIAVLAIMAVPFEMVMLPLYVQVNEMGLADTYTVIVIPFLAAAVTIFFFRQYFLGVPKEILEAGRVDGVTEFGIFFRLVLPIARPAIAAMAILNGMMCWNNLLWPLLVLRSSEKFTLPIGLNTLITPYANNYGLLLVGSFFSLVPILILFLTFQRFFVEGMTAGAVKG